MEARNNGVGKDGEVLEFTNDGNCMNRVNADSSNTAFTKVDVITLDSFYDPNSASIVKIDVEGYEKFVFDGGVRVFGNPNVFALSVDLNGNGKSFGVDDFEVHKIITEFGFLPILHDLFHRKITLTESFVEGGNTVYVKDLDDAQHRVSVCPSIYILTFNNVTIETDPAS